MVTPLTILGVIALKNTDWLDYRQSMISCIC